MSHIHIDLDAITPHQARGYMALLSHLAILEQEVKAELPPTTLAPDSTSDRIVAEDLMRDTIGPATDHEKVAAENAAAVVQAPEEATAKRRGRPRKDSVDPVTTSATATATNETATPAAPVGQAPEQSPAPAAGAPQAPEASASTSSDQGPDLSALKNALGHVMQHGGSAAADPSAAARSALDLLERFGCRRISEVAELPAAKRIEFVKLAMAEGE